MLQSEPDRPRRTGFDAILLRKILRFIPTYDLNLFGRRLNALVFRICQKEKYLTPKISTDISTISLQHKLDILGEKEIFLRVFML